MKDSILEIIALSTIILGLILCYYFVFDYTPADSFFLEEEDNNAFLEGIVLNKFETENTTIITIYACKEFNAYSKEQINKSLNEQIFLKGSFTKELFFIQKYY